MLLPPNLYIWATMNTSDQSLFPIDSAFKRRWDWKYVKIADAHKGWKIVLRDKEQNVVKIKNEESLLWWTFIQQINRIINNMTSSADKQLGYFFCKADELGEISAETFVSKVVFYLWNDVFKDYGFETSGDLFRYKKIEDGKEKEDDLTFPDFLDEEGEVDADVVRQFIEHVMDWKADNKKD